jgi:hypothetical protein
MRRWMVFLAIGIAISASALSIPFIMEGIVYDTPADVNSAADGTYISFVGTIKNVGYERSLGGIGHFLEIEGFNGQVACKDDNFHIGEKVIVKGYIDVYYRVVKGVWPKGVFGQDYTPRAEVSRVWWPPISEDILIMGIVIATIGIADMVYSHRKKATTLG